MIDENVGIKGIGTYFPSKKMTAKEIADITDIPEDVLIKKFGITEKYIPDEGDTTSFMGIKAAENAIKNAGIGPEDIDLVIWNGAQHKDYPCWLASLFVAHKLGAKNAWGFDMEAMCGSMMAGMETAKSLMLKNSNINTVLLVSGYRNGDLVDLKEPGTSFMFDLSASGTALILQKGLNENLLLESAFKGDGSFSTDCIVPVGGTASWPIKPEDAEKYHFEIQGDPKEFKKRLGETTLPNFFWVIRESLRKSGFSQEDIDYLAILHFKKSAHDMIMEELGLSEEKTVYLQDYGHNGQNDQIISLELGLKRGLIKDGDTIVLVGAGLGFVWASSVVKWGKQ